MHHKYLLPRFMDMRAYHLPIKTKIVNYFHFNEQAF